MSKASYFFKDNKSYSEGSNLQSLVIDWLRFPLAIAVVFIHSFGSKEIDLYYLHANPFSPESIYDFLRIALSNVGTHFAVTVFFMFSGFLFFYKAKDFNLSLYKQKLRKRFKTLFIPYVCWIILCILHTEIRIVASVIIKGRPASRILQYFTDNGGLHMFWDSSVWGLNRQNWIGWETPMTGPVLIPLWFVRDLMVIILLTPAIYSLIKRFNLLPVILLAFCYISGIWFQIPGFTVTTFFWFSLGAYFSIKGKCMIASIYNWRFPAYILCICTLLPLIWFNGKGGDGATANQAGQVLYPFYVIASAFSVISIATTVIKNGKMKVYPHLAKASFFVFLCHPFVLCYIPSIINRCLPFDNYIMMTVKYLATPLATVAVCLAIYRFLDQYFSKFLSFITGSRK